VKYAAKKHVNAILLVHLLFLNKLWWAQVTVTPLLSKIIVLSRGTPNGFTKCIPNGDQFSPNSCAGTKAASKNVQKIQKKNINSLKTNKTTPNLKPSITKKLW
jgi:hypothetical protein